MTVDGREVHGGQENAVPSVEMTRRFLVLCDRCGSDRDAVAVVAPGRQADVSGLPERDDWTQWDGTEMRAVVDYPQGSAAVTESAALHRPRR